MCTCSGWCGQEVIYTNQPFHTKWWMSWVAVTKQDVPGAESPSHVLMHIFLTCTLLPTIIWSLTLGTTEYNKVTKTYNLSEDEQTSPFEFTAFLLLS